MACHKTIGNAATFIMDALTLYNLKEATSFSKHDVAPYKGIYIEEATELVGFMIADCYCL